MDVDTLTVQWQQVIDYDDYHEERFQRRARTNNIAYAKEVANVIKLGVITVEQTKAMYNEILKNFGPSTEASKTQQGIYDLRKFERKHYHELIDEVCKRYDPSLTWRNVKFAPSRAKRCILCQSHYYDVSRNGKRLTCDTMGIYRTYDKTNKKYRYRHEDGMRQSVCAVLYEQRRRAAPPGWTEEDIVWPHINRRVQEVLERKPNYRM